MLSENRHPQYLGVHETNASPEEAKKEYVNTALQRHRLNRQLERLKDLYQLGDLERERYLADRERLRRELAAIKAQNTEENAELDELAGLLKNLQQGWDQATQEQRNRLARLIFEEIVINDNRVVAMKPRPELAGFFALDCQVRGLEVHRGGSDGASMRVRDTAPAVGRIAPVRLFARYFATPRLVPPSRTRLAPALWQEIASRAEFESLRDLAIAYDVSHETIRSIIHKATAREALIPIDKVGAPADCIGSVAGRARSDSLTGTRNIAKGTSG